MFFPRKYYLDQLVSAEGNGMIKVITGHDFDVFMAVSFDNFYLS